MSLLQQDEDELELKCILAIILIHAIRASTGTLKTLQHMELKHPYDANPIPTCVTDLQRAEHETEMRKKIPYIIILNLLYV